MINMEETYIIVIKSYNYAIKLYKILINKKYNVQIIATPCRISSGCSRAIKVHGKALEIAKEEMKKNNIPRKGIYIEKIINNRKQYIKIEE